MRTRLRRLLPWGVAALFVAGALALRQHLGIEWSAEAIRDLVAGYGIWGPVAFVAITTFRSVLLVPSQILLVAAGVCFGSAAGTLYGALGLLISGSIAYLLTRTIARKTVRGLIPPTMRSLLDGADSRTGGFLLFLGTAYPVGPLTAYHGGAALTSMGVPAFLVSLSAGALVRAWTYTAFGDALVEGDPRTLAVATGVLVAVGGLPLLHPRTRAFVRAQFTLRPASEPPVADTAPGDREG